MKSPIGGWWSLALAAVLFTTLVTVAAGAARAAPAAHAQLDTPPAGVLCTWERSESGLSPRATCKELTSDFGAGVADGDLSALLALVRSGDLDTALARLLALVDPAAAPPAAADAVTTCIAFSSTR
jgi:hypothetical protein